MSKVVSVELLERYIESYTQIKAAEPYDHPRQQWETTDWLRPDHLVDEIKSGRLSPASPPGVVEALICLRAAHAELLSVVPVEDGGNPPWVKDPNIERADRALAALTAEARSPWIPISPDTMPKNHQPVALLDVNRFRNCDFDLNIQDVGYLETGMAFPYWSIRGERAQIIDAYTHWMPLPDAPSGGEKS
jgi:hypothetical protein